MPIYHKFLNKNWGNGFQTHNSILDTVPYEPEAIFIGTFNHGWDWNNAEFFYGRGMYMWTILSNLFLHNQNLEVQRVIAGNDIVPFEICQRGKIIFADIVKGTKPHILTQQEGNSIIVNNNYIWDDYGDDHLDTMGANEWLDDNVEDIVKFINSTESIKHIYFTFKSGGWLVDKLNLIIAQTPTVTACSIFTPTGSGFRQNLMQYPARAWSLAHCWVWNGLPHETPINKPSYGHFNHDWLITNEVNPNNF
ncbi:hypothetical protein [Rufibacter tibetensis]|uniref:Uncharacterized protein n=1 Tax=Rufibacter tibetensis TaxID=512763 RepID=A0A0P0C6B3_9BACT|nr:hypothetical protein [Rufibacter tibetensis]ALJ00756.1 hypothetical protein DC20_19425 [Rufibacter tibetensis]